MSSTSACLCVTRLVAAQSVARDVINANSARLLPAPAIPRRRPCARRPGRRCRRWAVCFDPLWRGPALHTGAPRDVTEASVARRYVQVCNMSWN